MGGRDEDAEQAYLSEVAASDIYVGLLGSRYGRPDASTGYSATHTEFPHAVDNGLRIAIWTIGYASQVGPGIQEPTDCERRQRDRTLDAEGFVKRLPIFLVVLLVALAGCTGDSAAPSSMRTPTSASSSSPPTSSEIVDEQCVDEMVDQPPDEAVGEVDLAAWLIEDQLPPPLRTAGLFMIDSPIPSSHVAGTSWIHQR